MTIPMIIKIIHFYLSKNVVFLYDNNVLKDQKKLQGLIILEAFAENFSISLLLFDDAFCSIAAWGLHFKNIHSIDPACCWQA